MTTVTAYGGSYQLQPGHYWHLAQARGSMLLHNAFLAQGICWSISSFGRRPGMENAITMYGAFGNPEKEQAWERIRLDINPELPTRQHALFLFDNAEQAERAWQTWFPNENRVLVEARIVVGSAVHRADSRWLHCLQQQWDDNAKPYWRGEMTADPLPEVIVDGGVYFPDWENPPFGRFAELG
jgi:hypothetical protein